MKKKVTTSIWVIAIISICVFSFYFSKNIEQNSIEQNNIKQENLTKFNLAMKQIQNIHESSGYIEIDVLEAKHSYLIKDFREFYVVYGYITEEEVDALVANFQKVLPEIKKRRQEILQRIETQEKERKEKERLEKEEWLSEISKRGIYAEYYAKEYYTRLTAKQKENVKSNYLRIGDPFYMVYMMDWDFDVSISESVYGKSYHFYDRNYSGYSRFSYVTARNGVVDYISR